MNKYLLALAVILVIILASGIAQPGSLDAYSVPQSWSNLSHEPEYPAGSRVKAIAPVLQQILQDRQIRQEPVAAPLFIGDVGDDAASAVLGDEL